MKKNCIRSFALLLSALILSSGFFVDAQQMSTEIKVAEKYDIYSEYSDNAAQNDKSESVFLYADNITSMSSDAEMRSDYNGQSGSSIYTGEDSKITWKMDGASGWYTMRVTYYPEDCRSSCAKRQILVNNKVPFDEASEINFYCSYVDKNGITQDYYGNDIRSTQEKSPRWLTMDIYDKQQYESTPLKFYLEQSCEISLSALKEPMTVYCIELIPYTASKSYETVISGYKSQGISEVADAYELIEAEKCTYKSDPTIVPVSDNSVSTSPHDNYHIKLNKLSGGNYKTPGQFTTWTVNAKKAGLYYITLKTKQNYRKGLYSTRRIYINGEVPFAEANNIKFKYSDGWVNTTLGDGNSQWLFYLKEGINEIKTEVVLGDMGQILRDVDDVLENLNTIYREILAVTGSSPDKYRDYGLGELIPDTIANIKIQSEKIAGIRDSILDVTGQKGSDLSIFDTLTRQMDGFYTDPDKIPVGFSYFKTNIGSLGTWFTTALSQPLDIDYIVISGSDNVLAKPQAGFFRRLVNSIASFVSSFVVDYNKIGNMTENNDDPVVVWMTTGRDQMQVMKVLIQNSFVQETGINVQVENVEGGSVLKATAAGNGPDVLLGASVADPVNYALRNAVYDLSQFEDIKEVCNRFYPESLVPFTFNEKIYALPETISYQLLFYRSDILNDMDIALPETWQDVIETVSVLQKDNMTFGLPVSNLLSTYSMFMYQHSGKMYSDTGSKCLLSDPLNSAAFETLVNFFTNYSLELQYDFVNRFRTGEIPIAMDAISAYNNLKVSAPEIDGLWGIALLPGVTQGDGSINRSGYLSVSGSLIFSASKQPEKAYEFLKWWTRKDIQTEFGTEIESILGPSSRYLTANKEAFVQLPWSDEELNVLLTQLKTSYAVPEVPGSYYVGRHLNNAFRSVIINGSDIKDSLAEYNDVIDEELTTKRNEFGIE